MSKKSKKKKIHKRKTRTKKPIKVRILRGECHKKAEPTATIGRFKKGKKRLTEKQKKALAKGRKVLDYIRTGRQVSEPLEPLLIKEGFLMAKTKSKKKRGRKMSGFEGFEGRRKGGKAPRVRVVHKVLHGDPGPAGAGLGIDLAGLLAGAIGLSFVASLIPIKNPKWKTLIPIGAGIAALFSKTIQKNRFGSRAALGGIAIGSYSLVKQLAPKLPLMGAADTAEGIGAAIMNLPPEEKAILGLLPEPEPTAAGAEPGEMLGTEVIQGAEPGEMLGAEPGEMLGQEDLEGTEVISSGETSDFE